MVASVLASAAWSAPVLADPPRSERNVPMQVGGVAMAVVGGGLMVTSVVFEVRAQSEWSDIEDAAQRGGQWTPALQDTYDAGRTQQLLGGLVLAGGAALAVLGLVLYVEGSGDAFSSEKQTEKRKPRRERTSRDLMIDAARGRWTF